MFENFITFFRNSPTVISDETQSHTDAANCEADYLTVSLSNLLKSKLYLGKNHSDYIVCNLRPLVGLAQNFKFLEINKVTQ